MQDVSNVWHCAKLLLVRHLGKFKKKEFMSNGDARERHKLDWYPLGTRLDKLM